MQYIVLDLEWNQPYSKDKAVRLSSGRPLMSEIIQIGAVRLDEKHGIQDHFLCGVSPKYYKKLHYKVRQLTGMSTRQLRGGQSLAEAAESLRDWCGNEYVFLTWSNMDIPILLENLELHGLSSDWVAPWYDLQLMFNQQTGSTGGQVALQTAAEQLAISLDSPMHDALNDAFVTARVGQKLDIERGIRDYYTQVFMPGDQLHKDAQGRQMCAYSTLTAVATREQLLREPRCHVLPCPVCGAPLSAEEWIASAEDASSTWALCQAHGRFLFKLRLKSLKRSKWCAALAVYTEEEAEKPPVSLPAKPRRRRRSRRHRRGRGQQRAQSRAENE